MTRAISVRPTVVSSVVLRLELVERLFCNSVNFVGHAATLISLRIPILLLAPKYGPGFAQRHLSSEQNREKRE